MLHAEIGNLLRAGNCAREKGTKWFRRENYDGYLVREMESRPGNEESITRVGNKNRVVKAEGTESLIRVRMAKRLWERESAE